MNRIVLVRYGEIILKGMNRPVFESLLVKNIKKALKDECPMSIHWAQATIYIEPEDDSCVESIVEKLKRVFGIVSIVVAYPAAKDIDELEQTLADNFSAELSAASTFKVIAKRSDKTFHMTSPQICEEIGGRLLERFPNLSVDVHSPEVNVYVEIRETGYVHLDRISGAGGMPSGSNGKAMLLLSGGIDSPVAGYMIGKRGVQLEAIHFFSYPYTSDRAKDKVLKLGKIIAGYTGSLKVHIVPFTDIQLQIRDKCPEEHLTLVMRRFMMQISQRIAEKRGCSALITGESIGQVASQTMGALAVTDDAVTMPVFRPLIGMDKEEIVEISRKIDTYETSILPYEDCCTVFTPRHPSTKPKLAKVLLSQNQLDIERLIDEAVEGTEIVEV
ncbi:MAG: tRNA 4-thiouridine(8) synthase ThiI [Clostridia bacterium]|nr:tRNA 4-thiouridine(8) synthase ThiI [Clostridia bacterium]